MNNPNIDGLFNFVPIFLENDQLFFSQKIDENDYLFTDDFGIGVVCRKPYKKQDNNSSDYQITELGKKIHFGNNPNCYIEQSEDYPRSNPKEISRIYLLKFLKPVQANQQLIVQHTKYFDQNILHNTKVASSPLRQKPDYGWFTTEDRMNEIAQQLYQQSKNASKIVLDLYNMQVKNASKYL